jgi:hypothetical protein
MLAEIDTSRMVNMIDRMCENDFNGRRAGGPEQNAVIDYLTQYFKADGLVNVPGLKGYRQPLTMRYSIVHEKEDIKATLAYSISGKYAAASRSRVFPYPFYNGHGGLDIHSRIVFVGYGVSDPAEKYDNYAGLDVKGKIVLWVPGQPAGLKSAKSGTDTQKLFAAYKHGAAACLLYKPASEKDDSGRGFDSAISDLPCIGLDKSTALEVMPGLRTLGKLKLGTQGLDVRLRVNPVYDPARPTSNVVAFLPGSDPHLRQQVVMIGAHFDHLGRSSTGIFRGADDNASGVSVVLEAARAITAAGLRPKRSIAFICWAGEEGGLIGSNYFADHPPFPLKDVVSNIVLDMVGEGTYGKFETTGARAYPQHYRYVASSGADLGLSLESDVIRGVSDHMAFNRKDVPTSLLYTAGEHPYYHTVRDTPAGINPRILTSSARLAALSVWRAANG